MLRTLGPVAALLLSVGFVLSGNGLQQTLLPVRGTLDGFSPTQVGLLATGFFMGFAVGCLVGPRVVRRIGHIRAFAAMASLASCVVLVHAIIVDPVFWWILRALTGFAIAILSIVSESWLNERATNQNRGRVFAIYSLVNQSVIAIGQLLLVFGDPAQFPLFAVASVLMSIAVLPVAMTTSAAPPTPVQREKMGLKRLFIASPVAVVAAICAGLSNGSFNALAPVFVQDLSGSFDNVAFFLTLAVGAGAAAQFPLGRLSDRSDRRYVIIGGASIAAIAGILITTVGTLNGTHFGIESFVCVMIWGASSFTLYALSAAHMNDHMGRAAFVEASGSLLLVFSVGAMTGPVLASLFVQAAGIEKLFLFTAGVHGFLVVYVIYRMTRRVAVPADARGDFADAYRMAGTVSNISAASDAGPVRQPAQAPADPSPRS